MVTAFSCFGGLGWLQTGYNSQKRHFRRKKTRRGGFCALARAEDHLAAEASAAGAAEASATGAEASAAGAVAATGAAGAAFLLLAMPKPTARPTASTITATKTAHTTG